MKLMECPKYLGSLKSLHQSFPHWERLDGRTIFISGMSGMIGSFLADAIMLRNEGLPPERWIRIIGMGRDKAAAQVRFGRWVNNEAFAFIANDISNPINDLPFEPDYWIHAASTTHPVAYASEPINTILANVLGTRSLLEMAARKRNSRFLLLSSVEIYGENRGDTEYFTEDYCGYLDCNTLRAGYPEAKRTSEALCQAYIEQEGVDAAILRLPRCYGPTMRGSDSKAAAQFIKKAVNREDIVLKSAGTQLYSYAHVHDAVLGILWVLCAGECGQAYNLGDKRSDITLKALAETAARCAGTRVICQLPDDETERKGYSTVSKALLDAGKLKKLGWTAHYDIAAGIKETIDILRALDQEDKV
ncbi:MAG: NAD-dependent epimerase/dehydratase family protein [Clostridiales bacterium]|nr:NAD-dependent epimerase/dehydratase family protein [Clostridiales bacterium]